MGDVPHSDRESRGPPRPAGPAPHVEDTRILVGIEAPGQRSPCRDMSFDLFLLIIVACAVIDLRGKKVFFTVGSFYEYGHYRGIRSPTSRRTSRNSRASGYCQPCHARAGTPMVQGRPQQHGASERSSNARSATAPPAKREDRRHVRSVGRPAPDHPEKPARWSSPDRHARKLCTPLPRTNDREGRLQQRQIVVAEPRRDAAVRRPATTRILRGSVVAAEPSSRPSDPAAGKTKAAACAGCHGPEGVSNDLPGPSLAGQNAGYFVERSQGLPGAGERDNPM